jgi:hypothetical protein
MIHTLVTGCTFSCLHKQANYYFLSVCVNKALDAKGPKGCHSQF